MAEVRPLKVASVGGDNGELREFAAGDTLPSALIPQLEDKVDKVTGKQLSTEDYTTGEKAKLGALPTNTGLQAALAERAAVTDVIGTERAVEQLLGQAVYNADLVGQLVRLLTADTMALKGLSVTALDINADTLRLRSTRTPAAADAAGEAGECCWDADYLYLCVATNTWKRTPLTTW